MKLAIMQPYLFPYAGYFNLVSNVDKFVFYDDVNFIKRGWINRNRLYVAGDVRYFTVPLSGASQNLKIHEVLIEPKRLWERKLLDSVRHSYSKAPHFLATFDLLREVFDCETDSIATLAKNSISLATRRMGIETVFENTSAIYQNTSLHGADRIVDICEKENTAEYVNLPGGLDLYDERQFSKSNIKLTFTAPALASYQQFDRDFVPGLSIIDMMMFNDFDTCAQLIAQEKLKCS